MVAKKKILVVDDSLTVISIFTTFLQEKGYKVVTASDGIEAINVFYQEMPDLVLLDVMMPKMNGYQVCWILKNDPEAEKTPIVMFTGENEPRDKFWGLQVGADRYLFKGFEVPEVLKVVEEELNKSEPYRKESIRKRKTITPLDILTKLNRFLDKRLFEMTILNEVTRIAGMMHSYDEMMIAFFDLLDKVFDYQVLAALLTGEGSGGHLIFRTKKKVTDDFFRDVKKKMLNTLSSKEINVERLKSLEPKVLDQRQEGDSLREGPAQLEVKSFASVLLMGRGKIIGVLGMASAREKAFTEYDRKLLQLTGGEASIILDNAFLYDEIKKLSVTDSLTRLYNHGHFQEQLRKEFKRAQRYGLNLSLLMIDIDNFKILNDTYGHQQGDTVLKELASLMKDTLREVDIVARYGGDEFVALLPGTSLQQAAETANRLRLKVEKHRFSTPQGANRITVSFGVAQYPNERAATAAKLLELTDKTLYAAKETGRNKVCIL